MPDDCDESQKTAQIVSIFIPIHSPVSRIIHRYTEVMCDVHSTHTFGNKMSYVHSQLSHYETKGA